MMHLCAAEDNALLLPRERADQTLYEKLKSEAIEEESAANWPPRVDQKWRRRLRMRRMDVACLAVVGLVACIVTVRQPALRTENPLLLPTVKTAPAPIHPDFVTYADVSVGERRAYPISFSSRSFEVDGRATLLLGTDFPYADAPPETWAALLQQAKRDGNNVVAVDVTWKQYEPSRGVFDLAGGANLTRVYELAEQIGVFVHARFHPRDCADSAGAAGMGDWKAEVERFATVMVAISRPFLASNGGPIILTELVSGNCASADADARWTGDLLGLLNTSTPWVTSDGAMEKYALLECDDARDCEKLAVDQIHRAQTWPLLWTRPRSAANVSAPDLAYHVARWFAVGGVAYIDHTTSDMLRVTEGNAAESRRQTVRLSLSKLRHVLQQFSRVLSSNSPVVEDVDYSSLRPKWQRALVFEASRGDEVVFLENADDRVARVAFRGAFYNLPARSVVLMARDVVLFNSSDAHVAAEAPDIHRDSDASIAAVSR